MTEKPQKIRLSWYYSRGLEILMPNRGESPIYIQHSQADFSANPYYCVFLRKGSWLVELSQQGVKLVKFYGYFPVGKFQELLCGFFSSTLALIITYGFFKILKRTEICFHEQFLWYGRKKTFTHGKQKINENFLNRFFYFHGIKKLLPQTVNCPRY